MATIYSYPYPSLNREDCRAQLLPPKGRRPGPRARSTSNANALLYLRDVPAGHMRQLAQLLDRNHIAANLDTIGTDYELNDVRVSITGNRDARQFLREFDDAIDALRETLPQPSEEEEEEQLVQKPPYSAADVRAQITRTFGDFLGPDIPIDVMIYLLIKWAGSHLKTRLRNFNSGILREPTLRQNQDFLDAGRTRTRYTNATIHSARLEEDMLWVSVRSLDQEMPEYQNIGESTVAIFEATYRVRVSEAYVLVHYARDTNSEGFRTPMGDLFSWAVHFISDYVEWRSLITSFMARHRQGPSPDSLNPPDGHDDRFLDWRRRDWRDRHGPVVDAAYELFLHQLFILVNIIQTSRDPTAAEIAIFERERVQLFAVMNEYQWALLPHTAWEWAERNARYLLIGDFPNEANQVYYLAPAITLRPELDKVVILPYPRLPVIPDARFMTQIETRVPTEWEQPETGYQPIPRMFERYVKTAGDGNMAQAERLAEDPWSDDDYEASFRGYADGSEDDLGYESVEVPSRDVGEKREKRVSFSDLLEPQGYTPSLRGLAPKPSLKRKASAYTSDASGTKRSRRMAVSV
ncbi:hypothetical protein F4804DRAFT_262554 [Jackrogersella minutella]|nr:hypothetical protein F4804DRAFT_262554 [Jackrogersella minutella]